MATYKVGYIIGSLAKASINRKLAKALIRLSPGDIEFVEIPIRDLPLYSYDYDADFPEVREGVQESPRALPGRALRDAGVQPQPAGRAQERDRLGEPAPRQEFIRAQALGRHRQLARQDRHRGRPAAAAQHPRASAIRRR